MTLSRRLPQMMLSAIFVSGGLDSLRHPERKVPMSEDVATSIAGRLPLPDDPEQLVRINGAVQVGAGTLLALGRLPRTAAIALSASLVPTTIAGHRFWEEQDPAKRAGQRIHFLKNVGLLGGLLLAALDTAGNPSLRWRAAHAARTTRRAAATVGATRVLPHL